MEIKAGSTFNGKGGEKVAIESIDSGAAVVAIEYPDGERERLQIVIDPEWPWLVERAGLIAAAPVG